MARLIAGIAVFGKASLPRISTDGRGLAKAKSTGKSACATRGIDWDEVL